MQAFDQSMSELNRHPAVQHLVQHHGVGSASKVDAAIIFLREAFHPSSARRRTGVRCISYILLISQWLASP